VTVRVYLAHLADQGASASTIAGRVAALATGHRLAGYSPSPTRDDSVKVTLAGIRRTIGTARQGKLGVTIEELRSLVAVCDPDSLAGLRDRALLVLCFAGAFRRSELVSLDLSDVDQTRDGLRVSLRRSKTDQEGTGTVKGLPYGSNPQTCPVRTLEAWLEMAGIADGPLFRPINRHGQISPERLSDKSVALIVKRAAEGAGLDPTRVAGHSLRRGFATTAARNRVPELTICRQTGHRSLATLRAYVEEATLFTDNAAALVGL
jgi:site-specific recombinase XerD